MRAPLAREFLRLLGQHRHLHGKFAQPCIMRATFDRVTEHAGGLTEVLFAFA
jgi:hypothetical protein